MFHLPSDPLLDQCKLHLPCNQPCNFNILMDFSSPFLQNFNCCQILLYLPLHLQNLLFFSPFLLQKPLCALVLYCLSDRKYSFWHFLLFFPIKMLPFLPFHRRFWLDFLSPVVSNPGMLYSPLKLCITVSYHHLCSHFFLLLHLSIES